MIYKCDAKTGEVVERFCSINEISSTHGVQYSLNRALKGIIRIYKGYAWCYAEDYNEEWVKSHIDDKLFTSTATKKQRYKKGVLATKGNKFLKFTSVKACAKHFCVCEQTICKFLKTEKELDGWLLERN